MNFKVSNNVDKVKYHSDVNFGKRNQDIVLKYLCLYFSNLFNETIEVKEFQNNSSRFDFYLAKKNILIELKSRRCTYEAYPTQIIGENKVKLAKKKMDNGYRVFYCFLLQDNLDLKVYFFFNSFLSFSFFFSCSFISLSLYRLKALTLFTSLPFCPHKISSL